MKPVGGINSSQPLPVKPTASGKTVRAPELSPQVSAGQPMPEKVSQGTAPPSFVVALNTAQGVPQQAASTAAAPVNAATQAAPASQNATVSSQIIVKFSGANGDPSSAAFLDSLAKDAGGSVGYVRAMSGGAYVLTVQHPANVPLDQVLQGLRTRSDVSYVERDAQMSTMGTGVSAASQKGATRTGVLKA